MGCVWVVVMVAMSSSSSSVSAEEVALGEVCFSSSSDELWSEEWLRSSGWDVGCAREEK